MFQMFSEDYFFTHGLKNYPKVYQDQILDNVAERQQKQAKLHKNEIREPVEVPMPFVAADPDTQGPLYVTRDWFVKEKKKQITRYAKRNKEMQIEMMELIARRDLLRGKLAKLDPFRPKDSEKIVKLNVELKDIQLQLEALSRQTGVDLKQLDHGTKFKRWFYSVKRTFANGWKKFTDFFKRHAEPITKVAIGLIPILFAIATKGSGSAPVPAAN